MEDSRERAEATGRRARKPSWLKVKVPLGGGFSRVRKIVDGQHLHTVCEDARCPNMDECWNRGTATFMILGDVCTRNCRFCAVQAGKPSPLDMDEPQRVAQAVRELGLRHVVITSVTRDDLADGGAGVFAETIRRVREYVTHCTVEILVPDFQGSPASLRLVCEAKPNLFGHNVETVPRLYPRVRPQADYRRSLSVLRYAAEEGLWVKSGFMVGLGETEEEILALLEDLREAEVEVVTIGQYLQPTKDHLPVQRFMHPEEFDAWKSKALGLGFRSVEAGPLVRSSYRADSALCA
ncbi:MAG: lipoyl synthase [Bacteroidota bacterium]|nr:lipoyl synthase [Bacteroidota bacterium]